MVSFYRHAAEQRLTEFAASAIDEARNEIQQSAILSGITIARSDIKAHVTNKTGLLPAIFTNLVAWITTIGIAFFLLIGARCEWPAGSSR